MNFWGIINLKLLLDVLFAVGFGLLLFSRVKEQRTLWLLRGYLFLVSSAWFIQRRESPFDLLRYDVLPDRFIKQN